MNLVESHQDSFDEQSLDAVQVLSISQKSGFGDRRGQKLKRHGIRSLKTDLKDNSDSVNVMGFSLNASVGVPANDRKRLEQLIRYMARGPLATERLSESFHQLIYKMKSPWSDGTTHVRFSYLDFIARLVALIPPPKMNMIRYAGVFAPNFRDRRYVVKKRKQVEAKANTNHLPTTEKVKRERLRWSEMLKRVFKVDVTVCPKCSGRMEQIAVIKDKATAKQILESLGFLSSFNALKAVEDRGPPVCQSIDEDFDQRDLAGNSRQRPSIAKRLLTYKIHVYFTNIQVQREPLSPKIGD